MGLEYRLFRDDTADAFHLGEGAWIKAFPFSGRYNRIPFKMETYHNTSEHLAKDVKRVYGPYFGPDNTEAHFLRIAKKLFSWCGTGTIWMTHSECELWTDGTLELYKVTADLTEPKNPPKPAHCKDPDGEFGVGYDVGTGPLWDHVCAKCLPGAVRLLDAQLAKWEKENVDSFPGGIHVEVSEKKERCDFDPTESEKVSYNPA